MSHVVVVGSINVDLIMRVSSLPKPGETVTGGPLTRSAGGKGANQAVAAARFGARTWMIGLAGNDPSGREMRDELARAGVDVTAVGAGGRPTGTALVMVDAEGENEIAVDPGANAELTSGFVEDAFQRLDAQDPVVLASLEVPAEAVIAAARAARSRGWRFILNPAPARPLPSELVACCDVITPNEQEAVSLGYPSVDDLLAVGAGAVVVTKGSRGAELLRAGTPPLVQEAFDVAPVDSTGAGDAFSAALAWSLARGADIKEAVRFAAAAGALATTALGARAGFPTAGDLERFVSSAVSSRNVALSGKSGRED